MIYSSKQVIFVILSFNFAKIRKNYSKKQKDVMKENAYKMNKLLSLKES